jgi:hypothetical protein
LCYFRPVCWLQARKDDALGRVQSGEQSAPRRFCLIAI